MKAARALTVGGVLGFLLLTGVSALRYPGGTQADRSREGYAFFGNYWCDLYRSQALNGEDHAVGAQLAQVGALAVVLAIFAGLWCASAWFEGQRPRRATRALSGIACLGMLAIPLMPADRFGHLHFLVIGVSAVPALLALALASVAVVRGAARATPPAHGLRVLTRVVFVGALLHFAQYVAELVGGPAYGVGVPAIQKVVTLLILLWLVVVALTPLASAPPSAPTREH
ncbi:MAG: hypothetical protein IPG17_08410 [Sandaracinaceae bacterium]|nr:hypothetical protein [Sandaracinaceae bacterium]